ncbi:hypothetical protein HID58_043353 [Brassica napus]|uniref:Uncharacterized protein n=1 Tax=Brassica napus TaxID=3708 RepID=A0ABQ8BHV7_BRANA|nr:hypothetical protein HID58_043353 [Brassica napus]
MALLYISHSDETERKARILRVQQGIEENRTESSIRLTKITKELDKGKGHVFSYQDPTPDKFHSSGSTQISHPKLSLRDKEEDDTESSTSHFSANSEPVLPTGFRLGPSSGGRVSGIQGMSKAARRRPSSWKRKAFSKSSVPAINAIVDLTLRVSDLIDGQTGTWDHNLVRQLIDEEDVNLVLNTKINLSRADKLIWGLSKNVSVTRDQKYQSYVARNGPAWLATQIGQEASA